MTKLFKEPDIQKYRIFNYEEFQYLGSTKLKDESFIKKKASFMSNMGYNYRIIKGYSKLSRILPKFGNENSDRLRLYVRKK